jgi:BlaI family penicillinase repressor
MTMADKPRISDAEWQVMQVLWEKSPLTVKEVIKILSKKTAWKSETIRTLINRLTKKKAIDFEKEGRRHYFYPLLSQEECVKADAESFLARSGAALLKPILATFIEKEQLSDEEIAELQRILDKKGGVR